MNETAVNIYGTIFIGAMAVGLFYCAYELWSDNPAFSIFLGCFGAILAFYSIFLFLLPLITNLYNKLKRKKK